MIDYEAHCARLIDDLQRQQVVFTRLREALEVIAAGHYEGDWALYDTIPCVCGCRAAGDHQSCVSRFASKALQGPDDLTPTQDIGEGEIGPSVDAQGLTDTNKEE